MKIEPKLQQIFDKAWSNIPLKREECKYLLSIDETSYESGLIRSTANSIIRGKNDNSSIILGQIGVETSPCPGKCKFCTFGDGHTKVESSSIDQEELHEKMESFCKEGDLYGLYLMTMHEYNIENFLNIVCHAKKIAPVTTQIWANIGDTDLDTFKKSRNRGYRRLLRLPFRRSYRYKLKA